MSALCFHRFYQRLSPKMRNLPKIFLRSFENVAPDSATILSAQ